MYSKIVNFEVTIIDFGVVERKMFNEFVWKLYDYNVDCNGSFKLVSYQTENSSAVRYY